MYNRQLFSDNAGGSFGGDLRLSSSSVEASGLEIRNSASSITTTIDSVLKLSSSLLTNTSTAVSYSYSVTFSMLLSKQLLLECMI